MSRKKVFIPANSETRFLAKLAKHAIERKLSSRSKVEVEIIEDAPLYKGHSLARFTGPERMGFSGSVAVIEPSMFAVRDITPLFETDLGNNRMAAIERNGSFDTSLMYVDAAKLNDWDTKEFIRALDEKLVGIDAFFNLSIEPDVLPLPARWGQRNSLSTDTRMLHVTDSTIYPWAPAPAKKEISLNTIFTSVTTYVRKLIRPNKNSSRQPDKNLRMFLLGLVQSAYTAGAIDISLIKAEIAAGRMHPDATSIFKQ